MDYILDLFWTQLQQNQFLSGGAILASLGLILAYLRNTPKYIYRFISRRLIIRLDILDRDDAFNWVLKWLAQQSYNNSCRLLSVKTTNLREIDEDNQPVNPHAKKQIILSPAPGLHFFWYKYRPILLYRHRQEGGDLKGGMLGIQESLNLTIFSRNTKLVKELLLEAQEVANPTEAHLIKIYRMNYDSWLLVRKQDARPLESVILKDEYEKKLVDDITNFLASKKWYQEHGIPYRRGYLLFGKPGNGKTSVITAIASQLNLNICILNLNNSYLDDDKLIPLFSDLPDKSLILVEDIDCIFKDRKSNSERVTLSGLLNAIDGITATDGRLIFMTTNKREDLDSALVRPGRCDIELEFNNATREQARQLCLRFFPDEVDLAHSFSLKYGDKEISMANLQGILIKHKDAPEGILNEV